eukprot:CAMPEP_0180639676 /NCGR_PEP_ID=MMETSP1037_2-20121125/45187_1 /TAXON_ID=632150 /ORGANISM="Azadinium spinosum, Strain 3D9" /LENGTH=31 /DNA_ID= /DNA_START= /DNA_END= /DNA_ORIENTATION=
MIALASGCMQVESSLDALHCMTGVVRHSDEW